MIILHENPADIEFRPPSIAEIAAAALAREEAFIRRVSRSMARHDPLLADDLAQEARIVLWDIDPARFRGEDPGYVRQAMITAMRSARRREWRASGADKREELLPEDDEASPACDLDAPP